MGNSGLDFTERAPCPGASGSWKFFDASSPMEYGDRVELDLPMTSRLEAIDPRHPQTVALVSWTSRTVCRHRHATSSNRANLLAANRWTSEAGK